jgi:hypothetical protein
LTWLETNKINRRYLIGYIERDAIMMRKAAIIVAAIAALATAIVAPAEARGWRGGGWGPGIGFGLLAGALAAGAYGAYGPYGYYGYGPRYYGYYGPGPYAYYGGPYYYGPRRYYRYSYW